MEDDLYVPASRALQFVDNARAYLAGNPASDEEWDDMSLRLEAILRELIRLLEDNDIAPPANQESWVDPNPYFMN